MFAAITTLAVLVGACGGGSHVSHDTTAARTVDIEMRDIAYFPDRVTARTGETVRFVFRNTGKVRHDAFIGDETAQIEHENDMAATADMHHGGSNAITVEPGATGELTHTFLAGESVLVGCHEIGHYAAGMKLTFDLI